MSSAWISCREACPKAWMQRARAFPGHDDQRLASLDSYDGE
jgi:hypothetical protein